MISQYSKFIYGLSMIRLLVGGDKWISFHLYVVRCGNRWISFHPPGFNLIETSSVLKKKSKFIAKIFRVFRNPKSIQRLGLELNEWMGTLPPEFAGTVFKFN